MEFGRGRGLFKRILSDSPVKNIGYTDRKNDIGCINSSSFHENNESEKTLAKQLYQLHFETETSNNALNSKENGFEILGKESDNEPIRNANKKDIATDLEMKHPKNNSGYSIQKIESIKVFEQTELATIKPAVVDQTEGVTIKPAIVDFNIIKPAVDDKTIKAEEDWHLFKCERRINKILSEVTEDNISTVFTELEHLIEEGPLSSRYINCSEIKQLIEVLIRKSIQSEVFLPFGPCLLKLVSEHSMIEFQKYFPDIIHAHRKENITICSTDNMLSTCGKHFCQLLGHMLSLPRQTCTQFYETVLLVVEECVARWSYPESNEVELNGFHENLAIVFGLSLKYLLLEIIKQMIPCDKVISKQMKKFMGFLRESILNKSLSRNVREVFLDAMIEVQIHSSRKHFGENNNDLNEEKYDKEKHDYESLNDGDQAKHENNKEPIKHLQDINKNLTFKDLKKENISVSASSISASSISASSNSAFTISVSSEKSVPKKDDIYSTSTLDPFLCVKQLLREQDVLELIPIFIKHGLDDFAIMLPTIKSRMEAANIKRLTAFQIDTVIKKTNFQKLRERAVSSISSNVSHSQDNPDTINVSSNQNKISDTIKLSSDPIKLSSDTIKLSSDLIRLTSNSINASSGNQEDVKTLDTLNHFLVNNGNCSSLSKTASSCNSTRKIAMNFNKSSFKQPEITNVSAICELNSRNAVNDNNYMSDKEPCFINEVVCPEIDVYCESKDINEVQNTNFLINSSSADPNNLNENIDNEDNDNDDEPDVVIEDEQYENCMSDSLAGNENRFLFNSAVNGNITGVNHLQYEIKGRGVIKQPDVTSSPSIHQNKYFNGSNHNTHRGYPRDRFLHKGQRGFNRGRGNRGYNRDFQKASNIFNKRSFIKNIDKDVSPCERMFESGNIECDIEPSQSSALKFEFNIEPQSSALQFGMNRPRACLRCQSNSHQSDDCNVNNPFFT